MIKILHTPVNKIITPKDFAHDYWHLRIHTYTIIPCIHFDAITHYITHQIFSKHCALSFSLAEDHHKRLYEPLARK